MITAGEFAEAYAQRYRMDLAVREAEAIRISKASAAQLIELETRIDAALKQGGLKYKFIKPSDVTDVQIHRLVAKYRRAGVYLSYSDLPFETPKIEILPPNASFLARWLWGMGAVLDLIFATLFNK